MKEFLKKYWKIIIYSLCGILVIWGRVNVIKDYKETKQISENNIKALTDSVHHYKTIYGNELIIKQGLETEVSDLSKYSSDLEKEVNEYKKTTGTNVKTLIKTVTIASLPEKDTMFIMPEKVSFSLNKKLDFSDKYRTLTGNVIIKDSIFNLHLDKEVVPMNYSVGVDEKNKVFVKTDNPYIKLQEISGFTIPKNKQKKFGLGIQVGYGLNYSGNSFRLGPTISVGLQYNFLPLF
jgi:hypothetical protein